MSLCFTRSEIAELAHRRRKSAVIRWLRLNNIPFVLDADGWPQVLRTAILDQPRPAPDTSEPKLNFG